VGARTYGNDATNSTIAATAAARCSFSLWPEAARGLKEWSPSSSQRTRMAGERS
jgi:hypothetical protein